MPRGTTCKSRVEIVHASGRVVSRTFIVARRYDIYTIRPRNGKRVVDVYRRHGAESVSISPRIGVHPRIGSFLVLFDTRNRSNPRADDCYSPCDDRLEIQEARERTTPDELTVHGTLLEIDC